MTADAPTPESSTTTPGAAPNADTSSPPRVESATGRGRVPAWLVAVVAFLVVLTTVAVVAPDVDAPTADAHEDTAEPAAPTGGAVPAGAEPATSEPEADQAHGHGPHGEYAVQYEDLPPGTQAQLDVVREIIERYPTAGAAEAAGYSRATINLKGIAAHYIRGGAGGFATFDETFDIAEPEAILVDGETPDAPVVGVSYLVSGPDPDGFAGEWDVWHRHNAVCFAGGYVTAEIDGHPDSKINTTEEACKASGGLVFPIDRLTMIHVWMKPGYESADGVFSHDHPELYD